MCLLWLLLQFIILVMYWDEPALSSQEEGGEVLEMKREEPQEEEGPLLGPDEQPSPSYCGPGGERPGHGCRSFSGSGGET